MNSQVEAVLLVRGADLEAAAARETAEGRAVRALLAALLDPGPSMDPQPKRAA